MKPITNGLKKEQGFTFIEIIMVLVIIFVLGAYMVMRPAATSDISAAAAADQVEAYIRYVQATAMSSQAQLPQSSVVFASDAGGWYFTVGNQNYHVPQGISLSFSGSITFNSLGEPIPPIGTVTIGSTTITVVQTTGKVTRS